MGKLIDPERTRRAKQAREDRAARILDAAHAAFVRFPYADISLDTIGQQAGIKQGQATLAYRSREELYMTVIRKALEDWCDGLEADLRADEAPMTQAEAADMIAASLAARHDLTRLLGPLHTALELHEDGMQVHEYYQWQRSRLLTVAEVLASRLSGVHPWNAFDALYRGQLVAAAVHPVSRPVGNLAVDLMAEEHQVFALDLEDEVQRAVLSSLSG